MSNIEEVKKHRERKKLGMVKSFLPKKLLLKTYNFWIYACKDELSKEQIAYLKEQKKELKK